MNISKDAVLLLCCFLGSSTPKPLTMSQFRDLCVRLGNSYLDESCNLEDLYHLGYRDDDAHRIDKLLSRHNALAAYLEAGKAAGITPLTCACPDYPDTLIRQKAFYGSPVLFAKGDPALLRKPAVSVIGSRALLPENRHFAETAGCLAAEEGYALISGGAAGADTAAQEACLAHGGSCIVFVADRLEHYAMHERVLYISELGYDLPFSAHRALHRNLLIHMLGEKTLAAQCAYGKGGTWQGCTQNLQHRWSDLFVYDDGSRGMQALIDLGAVPVENLTGIRSLSPIQQTLF